MSCSESSGLVELAHLGEDPELAEHALHAEGARLVGDDRHHVARRSPLSRTSVLSARTKAIVVEMVPLAAVARAAPRRPTSGGTSIGGASGAARREAAARGARGARAGSASRGCRRAAVEDGALRASLVAQRHVEAVAEGEQRLLVHLLRLVGDVLALAGAAHAVALDGLGEDHRGLALVVHGGVVGGVDLARAVAAAVERPDLRGRSCRATRSFSSRVGAEEVLAHVVGVARLEGLVLAVDGLVHAPLAAGRRGRRRAAGPSSSPQMTLMTFQPAPRKLVSSSWMILPLPRTGPSRRCRLQLTTKTRLSRCSRPASEMAPIDSGSSISPSPMKAQTLRPAVSAIRGPGGTSGSAPGRSP